MKKPSVSRLTTHRLSVYLRCLNALEASGVKTVSSRQFAEQFHLNSAQIRKDLANFGEFGVRGVGYYVQELKDHLIKILGLDREYRVVIVGAGNLGMALSGYRGFNTGGFSVVALFDTDRERVRRLREDGLPAHDAKDLVRIAREKQANMAILSVPASAGQRCLDEVAGAGIRAVLSFVPVQLRAPGDVELTTVDLKVQLEGLAFRVKQVVPRRGAKSAGAGTGAARGKAGG